MTDKELLEKAAKADGRKPHPIISGAWSGDKFEPMRDMGSSVMVPTVWNPLTDDGDALRLAVNLGISVDICKFVQTAFYGIDLFVQEDWHDGVCGYAATRRAITRAAAAMVKE